MNDEIIVNVWETGVTPEDVLKRSHNGMAPRKEHDLLPWKTDAEIYNPAELTGLTASPASITLKVGGATGINITSVPEIANLPELYWESSNTEIAWVEQNGTVHGLAEGEATITATKPESDIKATITVTVSDEEPEPEKKDPGLAWSAESVTVTSAEDQLPTLTNPNNLTVTYSSSVEGVATVSEEGVVTLVDGGETVITASFAGNEEYKEGTASYTLTYNKQ